MSGASPRERVYDPSRKSAKAIDTYISENVMAVKNFAEYLRPGELDSVEALQPGEGGIVRDG